MFEISRLHSLVMLHVGLHAVKFIRPRLVARLQLTFLTLYFLITPGSKSLDAVSYTLPSLLFFSHLCVVDHLCEIFVFQVLYGFTVSTHQTFKFLLLFVYLYKKVSA